MGRTHVYSDFDMALGNGPQDPELLQLPQPRDPSSYFDTNFDTDLITVASGIDEICRHVTNLVLMAVDETIPRGSRLRVGEENIELGSMDRFCRWWDDVAMSDGDLNLDSQSDYDSDDGIDYNSTGEDDAPLRFTSVLRGMLEVDHQGEFSAPARVNEQFSSRSVQEEVPTLHGGSKGCSSDGVEHVVALGSLKRCLEEEQQDDAPITGGPCKRSRKDDHVVPQHGDELQLSGVAREDFTIQR